MIDKNGDANMSDTNEAAPARDAEERIDSPAQQNDEIAPVPRLLLKPGDAARALGISIRLLWSLTRDGTIPAVRLGRAVRYSPAALAEWVSALKK
ncbi:MAG TPA: helix-turn-helix domain-containing protein [Gemmataceae bacterium]|jgi:excisionase family DNA binding protein|nr:helix-turn-helix domain-containing protein [Gemmataceae bacterium]